MRLKLILVINLFIFFSCTQSDVQISGKSSGDDSSTISNAKDYRVDGAISYEINSGGDTVDTFIADSGLNTIWKELGDGKEFKTFGVEATAISTKSSVVRGPSTPDFIPLDIFESLRYDQLDESHHSPGLDYRFKVGPGNFILQLHFLMTENTQEIRVTNDSGSINRIISVPTSYESMTYTYSEEISIAEGQDTLSISLFPNFPSVSLEVAGLGLYAQSNLVTIPDPYDGLEKRYISVSAVGRGDGSDWSNAATFSSINSLLSELSASGGVIFVDNEAGEYSISSSINIYNGGASNLIYIVGKGENDGVTRPVFVGTRTSPWPDDASGSSGNEFMRLYGNASNLYFKNLEFKNFGNGIFRLADELENINIEELTVSNVLRLVENYYTGTATGTTASLNGLDLNYIDIRGYAKGVARIKYASTDINISHIFADSESQTNSDSASFAQGFHFNNTASNIVVRKVTGINHYHNNESLYWNADSFVAESSVTGISFIECIAAGNTDGGIDSKSMDLTIQRMVSLDNKRNYRLWGDTIIKDSFSYYPYKRGGTGDSIHLGVYNSIVEEVEIDNMVFIQSNSNNPMSEEDFEGVVKINNGVYYSTDPDTLESLVNSYEWVELSDSLFHSL